MKRDRDKLLPDARATTCFCCAFCHAQANGLSGQFKRRLLRRLGNQPGLSACFRLSAGRVKTLHPAVHGGILARRGTPEHMSALEQHSIGTIDVVVVNLYPFRQTVTAAQAPTYDVAVENIDIGEVSGSMVLQPPSSGLKVAGTSLLPAAKVGSDNRTVAQA